MTILDRVKERTGTELSDDELLAMIAGLTAEIDGRFGPAGEIEVTIGDPLDGERWRTTIKLPRPIDASQPAAIVEIAPVDSGDAAAEVTLAAADFRVLHGGRTLQRLTTGPHGNRFWAPLVRLTYSPLGEQAARDEVIIKVMALDLSYRGGLKSERAGDYQFTLGADAGEEREKLLASLAGGLGMVMA